ncbi:hypothetical protein IFM89_015239 [Coptis chinensis]|uniref:Homeobox-leucine zipper protein n=1 Tax=Coptis chinensis TaxID=261450 RepID=A0A835HF87_9MAGN|nr:hypothetical protein IFM89_015239 [Coptis chinensis]
MAAWTSSNFRPFDHTMKNIYDEDFNPFQDEMETNHHGIQVHVERPTLIASSSNNNSSNNKTKKDFQQNQPERKKRLSNEQIDALERCFQEEIKLEPERKMKLARELELQPRQVAVWFQNRRARWKVKQIERLYDAIKKDFDTVTKENQKLQEQAWKLPSLSLLSSICFLLHYLHVENLKSKLEDQASARQGSTVHTEASAEESVESRSVVLFSSNKLQAANFNQIVAECNYHLFNMEGYPTSPPYLGVLPSYP